MLGESGRGRTVRAEENLRPWLARIPPPRPSPLPRFTEPRRCQTQHRNPIASYTTPRDTTLGSLHRSTSSSTLSLWLAVNDRLLGRSETSGSGTAFNSGFFSDMMVNLDALDTIFETTVWLAHVGPEGRGGFRILPSRASWDEFWPRRTPASGSASFRKNSSCLAYCWGSSHASSSPNPAVGTPSWPGERWMGPDKRCPACRRPPPPELFDRSGVRVGSSVA
jgi:hypothetical protein